MQKLLNLLDASAIALVSLGDILVALAGQPVASEEDLGFILSAEDDATEITLEVIRRGEKKSLTLEL